MRSITISITSDIQESIIVFAKIPKGNVHLSLHGSHHKIAFFTDKRIEFASRHFGPTQLIVGEDTFCAGARLIAHNSSIFIGSGCLFSDEILIQAGDQHGVVDLDSLKHLNRQQRILNIGRHVWVGRRATLCNNADIGDGSIIGAAAVVAGKIPSASAAVGNPARVVRRNVSWTESVATVSAAEYRILSSIKSQQYIN